MKRFIYGLTLAAGMVLATSCTDKLDELLENPNAVNATTASPDFLLNSIQLSYQSLWYGISDRGARLTRQINQGSALYEAGFVSAAHSEADIAETVRAASEVLSLIHI